MIRSCLRLWCALATALVLCPPAPAANIVVSGPCTLADAIDAANNDDDAGGLCPPGGSGADVLELTADVTLTALHNTTLGANGLPAITSDITIEGSGRTVERDPAAPSFRLLYAGPGSRLELRNVRLRNGVATSRIPPAGYDAVGGAIAGRSAMVYLVDATVENNRADSGGALFGYYSDLILRETTVSNNYATEFGGGASGYQTFIDAANTTFSGNGAQVYGGAIWGGYASALSLVNSTVAANTAGLGGGISDYGSFGIFSSVYNTIIGYNAGGNCGVYFINDGADNLADDATCGATFGTLTGLDSTLADNGGGTRTHALLAGSAAIDAAGVCGLPEDQRGFARDALCDVGSVEFGAAPVGGSAVGLRVRSATCVNLGTSQTVSIDRPEGAWDCEAAGLAVTPGDQIRQIVDGRALEAEVGATAISAGGVRTLCRNQTSGQDVRFTPAGTKSWSCTAQGLAVEPGDRVIQMFLSVAE